MKILLVNEDLFNNEIEIEQAYPKTKSYRLMIAHMRKDGFLGKWRGVTIALRSIINY